jgi:anti-sigma regulatory factor (Ser/Thr protein kinase)
MALDQAFDMSRLDELRKAVLAEATTAGMPGDRAMDVMLAVHELAVNAVCHGGGAGRARLAIVAGELHCLVSDAGPGSADGDTGGSGAAVAPPWVVRPGHGLWLVHNAADHVSVACGLSGSHVTVIFTLPGEACHAPE